MSSDDQDQQLSEDEKMARDMQLALELQDAEDLRAAEEASEAAAAATARRLSADNAASARAVNNSAVMAIESGGYPTSLGIEHMLFVTCEVEGRLVEMLVDTGASVSAISYRMVKKLGLKKHLNRGVGGSASGVGETNVCGLLENVACQIGHVEFRLYFLVLENDDPWLILGLDQMRRFKCMVDLEDYNLIFGGKDGVKVPFLEPEVAAVAIAKKLRSARSGGSSSGHSQSRSSTPDRDDDQQPTSRAGAGRWGGLGSMFGGGNR